MSTSKCQISQRLCYFGTFYLHKRNSTCHWSVTAIVPTDLVLVPPPPNPHRPPIAREYPLATASLSGSYAAVGADSAHSQKKKKKKITRRAATRFRSVLVYLRLVSLKIVPPLFFFNGSSVKLHRAVKEVRHRSGAENPTTFVRADVFYYALCETVQGRN